MRRPPKRIKTRGSVPRNRRKSSGMPVSGLLRLIGSGMFKVFLFFLVLGVVSTTFVLLYDYLLSSPYMRLEHVEIRGVDEGIRNDLLQMCNLTSEQSLLAIKLDDVKKRMESHPWVRTATVERKFPDTLIAEIEKQSPAMLVLRDGFYYMNRWGELFKAVQEKDNVDFPVLTGLSANDDDPKHKLHIVAEVLEVLKKEKGPWSYKNLSEVHLDEHEKISLYFNHMQVAIRIPRENVAGKMDALKQVTTHLNKSGKLDFVTQIDLNHADGAIVSFRENQVSG